MLDIIAANADFIMAAAQAGLAADMVPTVWHQFHAKASTVPLVSSVSTATLLAVVSVTLFSVGLPVSSAFAAICAGIWTLVAGQRVWYGRKGK